jgi:hypothetical protein
VTRKSTDIPTVTTASGRARPVKGGSYIRNKDGSLTCRSNVPGMATSSHGTRSRLRPATEGPSKEEEK